MGGVTDALIQAVILLILAPIFGMYPSWNFILVFVFLFILVIGLVSIGLIIGSWMESPEGFGLITSFVNFPLFFLSGALYQLKGLPSWLSAFTMIDPVTYGVDAERTLMLGTGALNLLTDLAVPNLFAAVVIVIGTLSFRRMKI